MTNKLNLARNFVAANPNKSRAEYIAAFVELGLAPTSASLYHHTLVTVPGIGGKSNLEKATDFVAENPGLTRKEYIKAFVALGLTANSASLYHYKLVTSLKKPAKITIPTDKADRIELLNKLRTEKGLEPVKSWKKSGDLLVAKIEALINA